MAGADDSLKLQACFAALYAKNSYAAIADARAMTGNTWSVNPFDATSIPKRGVLLLPPGVISIDVPIIGREFWMVQGIHGTEATKLIASASFPHPANAGTVTVGTAGANDVITGSGTNWTSSTVKKGCGIVAGASTFPNSNPGTYGIVKSVNSTTSITLAWGVTVNGGSAPAASSYGLICPVFVHGDGTGEEGTGLTYGVDVSDMSFDANEIAGVVPELNWFGSHPTQVNNVVEDHFCGIGLQIEGSGAALQGSKWSNVRTYPGACATTASIPILIAVNGGFQGIDGVQMDNAWMQPTKPNVGIDVEGGGITLSHLQTDFMGVGVSINANTTCPNACAWSAVWQWGPANNIEVDGLYGYNTTTGVKLTATNGNPKNIILRNVNNSGFSNHLIDTSHSCTLAVNPEFGLAEYVINNAGAIAFSTSAVANCHP